MLRGLLDRGLEGVRLVISDDHESIKSAVAGELPGVEWQRYVVDFERNVLTSVPAGAMGEVAEDLKAFFKVKRSKTARALAEGFVERWKPVGTTPDPSFRAILSGVGEDVDLETVLY